MNTRFSAVGMPVGWAAIAKTVRDIDEDKIRNCKEDIDTLLVFVSSERFTGGINIHFIPFV